MLVAPLLIVSNICTFIITRAPLSSPLQGWANKAAASIRVFSGTAGDDVVKKNQFAMGEINFDFLGFFCVTLPVISFFVLTLDKVVMGQSFLDQVQKLKAIGNAFGMAGALALTFFLVPVARHSILLVAMGWSPLQALRIHIWAGYTSFLCILLHGGIHVIAWAKNDQVNIWEQVIPEANCWTWKADNSLSRECRTQWYNFTGMISLLFFLVLIVTSLNWFRRRCYNLFYVFHVVCGTGMLAAAVMHWRPIITYIAPSLIYYLASTMPVVVQAVSSRVRGGVKVVKVVHLANAGGCKEMHIATTTVDNNALERTPSMFVKLCVPSISLVWHPFTVFKHPRDSSTVRLLFRPVGPFTKSLALRWEEEQSTPVIVDGFYQTGNRCLEALHHDHVTFYCGGVAITPFLSLIPCLLQEIAKKKENRVKVTIRKLVLHWACREEGLAAYVAATYLQNLKVSADSIGFAYDIVIYHSNRTEESGPPNPNNNDMGSDPFNNLDTTLLIDVSGHNRAPMPPSRIVDNEVSSSFRQRRTGEIDKNSAQEVHVALACADDCIAPAMEPYRFMPARHTRIWQNLPALLAIGGSQWIFFNILFYYYNGYNVQKHDFYDRLWPLILCLFSAIGISTAFEGCAVVMSKTFRSGGGNDGSRETSFPVDFSSADEELQTTSESLIIHRTGRPTTIDIFGETRSAECPGIFMCGPPAMTKLVRREAKKENSRFGLTRYAIYEDPFQM